MEIIVNGKNYSYEETLTVSELLISMGKLKLPLAVRINGETIKRKNFKNTFLKDGDNISVIVFLGGG